MHGHGYRYAPKIDVTLFIYLRSWNLKYKIKLSNVGTFLRAVNRKIFVLFLHMILVILI